MTNASAPSKAFRNSLWIAQLLLALSLLSGAIMKFLPIEKISAMMPWTGEISPLLVRLLALIDLAGVLGILLPSLLKVKQHLTVWTAYSIIALMVCAIILHLSRGEANVIGFNIFLAILSGFVAWGRSKRRF